MCLMINSVQISIPQEDGSDRYVIIEPVLEKDGESGLRSTGVYKIYKDAFGDETHLFTEPLEIDEVNNDFTDEANPDYLGKLVFENGELNHFDGSILTLAEQAYLATYIESYVEPDR